MAKMTSTTPSKNSNQYWQHLLKDYSLSSKLWLEGFELPTLSKGETRDSTYESIPLTLSFNITDNKILLNLLHTAWALFLNRMTGADDIVYGTATYTSIGPHAITISRPPLPARSTHQEGESIQNFTNNLKKQLLKNEENAENYYNNEIAKDVESMISYLILTEDKIPEQNKKSIPLSPAQYTLALVINKLEPTEVIFYYDQAKLTDISVKNLIQHYETIAHEILEDPNRETTHFNILIPNEKKKLLEFSIPPKVNSPESKLCFHDLFAQIAKKYSDKIAVTDANNTLTYQQLDCLANQLARFLINHQVKKGDLVAVMLERTPAIIVAMLGIAKAGACYVPINPKYPDERIQFVLSDCQPTIILASDNNRIPEEYLDRSIILKDDYQLLSGLSTEIPDVSVQGENLAYIIFTSGTTGQPKGVMIKHESLTNLALWYQDTLNLTENDRASQFASSGFDSFFCETVPTLCVGASIHIIDDHSKLTPSLLIPWICQEQITMCDLPTSYAQIIFSMPWPNDIKLRCVKLGGENLMHYPTQVFPFDIWNIYGPTEATVECTFMQIYHANKPIESYSHMHLPPPIGKPIANSEAYIVDQHLELVPIGNVGELLIGGSVIAAGYLNRKQLTREKFIRHIYSSDPNAKLYRTGDLVRWLEDGNLEFVGRVDNQVKIRGYRIELSEVETTIRQYPDVAEVVVLAKEIVNGQKTLIAYLVPNLDKIRIPYHEKCLLNLNDMQFLEVISDDISKEGLAITGLSENIPVGMEIKINIKLPGASDGQWLSGHIMWRVDQRAGIEFEKTPNQMREMKKCIEYYLATHNLMETIQNASSKRNIRKALKAKLPDYMIPSVFCLLPHFPLTFNGKIDWKALPPPKDFERLLERQFVPPRTETEKTVLKIWCDILHIKQASMTDNFFDLGGNSLMVSQLSVQIMKTFNLSIPVKVFIDLPFIPVLAEYIDSKGKKYTYKSTIQEEIYHDTLLHDDIIPTKNLADIRQPGGILLTGVSGFLGIYLLRELLKKTEAKIYCLIRKGEFESAAKRLVTTIEQFHLEDEIQLLNRRIIVLEADIGSDSFGISQLQYKSMAEKIDTIYHCGAQVNTMASYTNLRNSNVQGTIEIIKFATTAVDKAIHYISTLSSAVKLDADGCYAEEFPDADSNTLVGGYAISKWVSERLLSQIKNRGLPVSIYRSGHIFGQADTGMTSVNNSLLYFIKGCLQLGLAPDWKENITFLPVDFASKAIVALSLFQPEKSAVYHLDHPHGIMWTDLVAWLQNYGYTINLCSHQKWREQLTNITPDNALYPFLSQYLADEEVPYLPPTNMARTMSTLNTSGIHYPDINDQLLSTYVNYLCDVNFFPTPEKQRELLSI